jgi:RNA polymerase sigma-70 factor (ECF subfamily)
VEALVWQGLTLAWRTAQAVIARNPVVAHSEHLVVDAATRARESDAPAALDEAAFNDLYRRTARTLWAYVRRMTGNAAVADDLLQEAFTRLLVQPRPPQGEAAQRAWLYRVASNLAIDALRRGKREVASDDLEAGPETATATTPSGRDPLLAREMGRAFGRLEVKERALLWLAYVEGAPHRDIGDALGVKEASVRVLLFRARKKLASVWTRRREERGR